MSQESSRYTLCRSAFHVFPCWGATSPSAPLLCSPRYPKSRAALHNVIDGSTSANIAATRAALDPHQCPETQRTPLLFPAPWRPPSSSGYLKDREEFREAPLAPSTLPQAAAACHGQEADLPCTVAAPSQEGCWSQLAREEGFGYWACAPRHSIKPELSQCFASHSSSCWETQLCRVTGGRWRQVRASQGGRN